MTRNKFGPPGSGKSLRVEELVGVKGSGAGVPVGEMEEAVIVWGLVEEGGGGKMALHRKTDPEAGPAPTQTSGCGSGSAAGY